MSRGIELKTEGVISTWPHQDDMPGAILHAAFMANQFGTICRVMLDGKEIALIRPQPGHAEDGIYQDIGTLVLRRMREEWSSCHSGRPDAKTDHCQPSKEPAHGESD